MCPERGMPSQRELICFLSGGVFYSHRYHLADFERRRAVQGTQHDLDDFGKNTTAFHSECWKLVQRVNPSRVLLCVYVRSDRIFGGNISRHFLCRSPAVAVKNSPFTCVHLVLNVERELVPQHNVHGPRAKKGRPLRRRIKLWPMTCNDNTCAVTENRVLVRSGPCCVLA